MSEMKNIIVRVAKDERHHVLWDKLDPEHGYAWWRMKRLPACDHVVVHFLCGEEILGEAVASVDCDEGCLVWHRSDATRYSAPVPFVMSQKQGWRYFREADDLSSGIPDAIYEAVAQAEKRERRRIAQERADEHAMGEIMEGWR